MVSASSEDTVLSSSALAQNMFYTSMNHLSFYDCCRKVSRSEGVPRKRLIKKFCACDCGRGPVSVGAFFFPSFLLSFFLFPFPFPFPYSLFPIPYSLFPIPYSLFPFPFSLFPFPSFSLSSFLSLFLSLYLSLPFSPSISLFLSLSSFLI